MAIKQIAKQRVQVLLEQAMMVCKTDPELSKCYIKTARRIAMSAKIRLPPEFKAKVCKNCNAVLVYGLNCRVRIKQKRESHVVVTCLDCGDQRRMLLSKKMEKAKVE